MSAVGYRIGPPGVAVVRRGGNPCHRLDDWTHGRPVPSVGMELLLSFLRWLLVHCRSLIVGQSVRAGLCRWSWRQAWLVVPEGPSLPKSNRWFLLIGLPRVPFCLHVTIVAQGEHDQDQMRQLTRTQVQNSSTSACECGCSQNAIELQQLAPLDL